jgi:hypothetical protein
MEDNTKQVTPEAEQELLHPLQGTATVDEFISEYTRATEDPDATNSFCLSEVGEQRFDKWFRNFPWPNFDSDSLTLTEIAEKALSAYEQMGVMQLPLTIDEYDLICQYFNNSRVWDALEESGVVATLDALAIAKCHSDWKSAPPKPGDDENGFWQVMRRQSAIEQMWRLDLPITFDEFDAIRAYRGLSAGQLHEELLAGGFAYTADQLALAKRTIVVE